MPPTLEKPFPYTTTFLFLDAELTGWAAAQQLRLAKQKSHVIVRWEDQGAFLLYLFDFEFLFIYLQCLGKLELHFNLTLLLSLKHLKPSLTLTELDLPMAGAVVVREDTVLGFFPKPVLDASKWDVGGDGVVSDSPQSFIIRKSSSAGPSTAGGKDRPIRIVTARSESSSAGSIDVGSSSAGANRVGASADGASADRGGDWDIAEPTFYSTELDSPASFGFEVSARAAEPALDADLELFEKPPSLPETPQYFNARTPGRVALNAQTYVIVQVAREAEQSTVDSVAGHVAIGDFIGTLTIDVYAPGLKTVGPTTLTLNVPASGDSERLRFGFDAYKAGAHQVDVMAWNGSAQVAGVTLQIMVEVETLVGDAVEARGEMVMRKPETGEYTLDIAMEADRRYRFQLRSDQKDVWPPMYSEPLLNARQQTYDAAIANLNAQARNLYGLPKEDQAIWLRGMGNLLFEQLVPDKLKEILIEHKNKINILNILSEADATPWELLFVADPDTGLGDFLAASTTVARWRYGVGPSRSLKCESKVLVLPSDAPLQAKEELKNLQNLLGEADTIGDLSSLNALLANATFDLLHFAAHNVNVPNAQGGAYVPFGKQRWDINFMAAVPRNRFKTRAPLVFMNACTTSGTTTLYTELASWADRFLYCGSGAFIGTLWEVRDDSARQFSETFYSELLQGKTLGAAMQAARTKLRASNPGDPTPLAYTLYGNPLARLEQA